MTKINLPPSPKLKAGIVGATGMVGQQLIRMLKDHPWLEVTMLAASAGSAGKSYKESTQGRWFMDFAIPEGIGALTVVDSDDLTAVTADVDIVFCAVSLDKAQVLRLEDDLAKRGVFVVSCNSAYRMDPLVPMMIPAANADHLKVIEAQRKARGYDTGAIIVKSNCSIQSYVIGLTPLKQFDVQEIFVHSEQAISGAGKTFGTWPEMIENVIPYIGGEEQKSEVEPLKVWGDATASGITNATTPRIKAKCVRVAVSDGHTAYVTARFGKPVTREQILTAWKDFAGASGLPSAAKQQIHYVDAVDRPQPRLDVMTENGMAVTIGQLDVSEDNWVRFTALAHNAILGAAGGAVLACELAVKEGYVHHRTAKQAAAASK
ncbi:MAG: aspartate-semialdehyde dehydrogenase family protein [Candidatus Obscuribacterales bacterium]|nr:aspartate-semialdehyde dehydrogenase family protein [Candidatus Obscuribacterales bacterium]